MPRTITELPQTLWDGLKKGRSESLSELYRLTYNDLLNFGMYYGYSATITKDAVNQMYAELWERGENLPSVLNIRAYLITYLRRKLTQEYKNGARFTDLPETETLGEPSYEESIVQAQESEHKQAMLKRALEKLTPRQRQLIELRFFQNQSNEEISAATGMHINTVYNTISSAIKSLRSELKKKKESPAIRIGWYLITVFFP